MNISFGVVIGLLTVLLAMALLSMLLPVLLFYSDSAHQQLLHLAAREAARAMSQDVAAKLDAGYHKARSAMRIARRIGVTPHDPASPPALNSQSYSPAHAAALGLDRLRYGKNLWLEKETRVMQQYHNGFTYLSSITLPLPHDVSGKRYAMQLSTCRFGNGNRVESGWQLQRGKLEAHVQLNKRLLPAAAPTLGFAFEIPINITGFGPWNERLQVPKNRDQILSYLGARASTAPTLVLPPSGTSWLAMKQLGASLAPALDAAAAIGARIPVLTEQQIDLIDRQYALSSLIAFFNRTMMAAFLPTEYRVARHDVDQLGDTRCSTRIVAPQLLEATASPFFQIAGYPRDFYKPVDALANEVDPASSIEEAIARDLRSRDKMRIQGKRPMFYFIDGRGNPIHSTEGAMFAGFRSNLSSALQRHPMESVSGCYGFTFPKRDGSPGMERIVSCVKNVSDNVDSQFVLLHQLRKSSEVNVSDFRAAMLAANRSSALLRGSGNSDNNKRVADLSGEFRRARIIDPRDGTRYDVTIAPLVTEDPSLWHYSIVVFTPENFLRGDFDAKRNASIGIAVAIGVIALLATVLATAIISRHVSEITLQMADPIGLDKNKTAATTGEESSSFSCSGLVECFGKLEELHEVETAFQHCRSIVDELRAFVNQDALLTLRRDRDQTSGSLPVTSDSRSNSASAASSKRSVNVLGCAATAAALNDSSSVIDAELASEIGSLQHSAKKKSVRFADSASGPASEASSPAHTPLPAPPAKPSAADAVSVSGSDNDNESGGSAEDDNSNNQATASYRKVPPRRKIDPNAPRLYSCVVVHFPIVQRLAASHNLLRDVTAAAAEMCHSLLSRLPVMAIEQFLGDGLIFAMHIRGLQRPSRTLSSAVAQLIRECGVFENKVDEIMAAETSGPAGAGADAAVCADDILMNGGIAGSTVTGTATALAPAMFGRRETLDDKSVPLVAVGIFCGPLRTSRHQAADCSKNDVGSSSELAAPMSLSSSRTMRATNFIGPVVAHAEKLCRERSAMAPTRVTATTVRDVEAELLPFGLSLAEKRLVSTCRARTSSPYINKVIWRGERVPAVGVKSASDSSGGSPVYSEAGAGCCVSAWRRSTPVPQACAVNTVGGAVGHEQPQHLDDPVGCPPSVMLRSSIFMPRCFVGLAMKPTSLATGGRTRTIALEPEESQQFTILQSFSDLRTVFALSRITADE